MNQVVVALFMILSIALLLFIFRTVFYAFFKKKDEREKSIVYRSMAHSYIVLFILYFLQAIFKLANYSLWERWWNSFKQGLYVEPVMLIIIILGVCLFINKKRAGG